MLLTGYRLIFDILGRLPDRSEPRAPAGSWWPGGEVCAGVRTRRTGRQHNIQRGLPQTYSHRLALTLASKICLFLNVVTWISLLLWNTEISYCLQMMTQSIYLKQCCGAGPILTGSGSCRELRKKKILHKFNQKIQFGKINEDNFTLLKVYRSGTCFFFQFV